MKKGKSNYPLIALGAGSDESVWLSEEERESHFHILGTTGEGKSKFLEYLIRHDIQSGNGLLLLDPSNDGDTAYKVLKYCAKVGRDKVLIIDPAHRWKDKVLGINPLNVHPSNREMAVSYLMDSVRVLFNQKDAADTPRIQRFLPALFSILQTAGLTLHEALPFMDYQTGAREREVIYDKVLDVDYYNRYIRMIDEMYRTDAKFMTYMSSTVGRLDPFFRSEYLEMCLGASKGVNFDKIVSEGWVVLVNLDADSSLDTLGSRLLGSLLINEILFAIKRLRSNNWRGVYYLYVDEAGEYATRRLARILELKRKSGVRMVLSHQHMGQIEDPRISSAIRTNAKLKLAFFIADAEERMKVVKMLYGGDIPDREVAYTLSQQKQRYAVVKKPKFPAQIIEIPNTPDIEVSKQTLSAYLDKVLSSEWYQHPEAIKKEFVGRLHNAPPVRNQPREAGQDTKAVRPGTKADKPTGRSPRVRPEPKPLDFEP